MSDHNPWMVVLDDCEDALNQLDDLGGSGVGWERWFMYVTTAVALASNPYAIPAVLRAALVDLAAICLMWARKL